MSAKLSTALQGIFSARLRHSPSWRGRLSWKFRKTRPLLRNDAAVVVRELSGMKNDGHDDSKRRLWCFHKNGLQRHNVKAPFQHAQTQVLLPKYRLTDENRLQIFSGSATVVLAFDIENRGKEMRLSHFYLYEFVHYSEDVLKRLVHVMILQVLAVFQHKLRT